MTWNLSAQKNGKGDTPDKQIVIQVLDNSEFLIADVSLSLNGYNAIYDSVNKNYVLRYKTGKEYQLKIEHGDYISVDTKINHAFKKYYLFKEGQPYVFRSGLNYPIIDYCSSFWC